MKHYNTLIVTLENNLMTIALNRPDVLNSVNGEMARELHEILESCLDNDNVRAILLTGTGRAFCAGQDLAEILAAEGRGDKGIGDVVKYHYNPIIKILRYIEKPVVCAVNGVAAGAGANIALACDIVVAAKSASFIQSFSKIGLIPDSGGTFVLPRLVGWAKATALMMTGEKVAAQQAEEMGMIYKVAADEKLSEDAQILAQMLASMPTKGLGNTKIALNRAMHNDLISQLDLEMELQQKSGETLDYKEGIKAFIEKRKPVFQGK